MPTHNLTSPIQSLDRGLALLESVGKVRRPVSVAELTRGLGIDQSSVFRLANTLKRRGFLAQVSGSKNYVLGSAIWRLASLFQWSQVLVQIAHEHVASLTAQTGESTYLAVREGREAVFVDQELSDQPLGVLVSLGRCVPLHCTAVGKALIADYDGRQLAELFGSEPLPAATDRTIRSIAALAKDCQRTRQQGFAVDDEEFYEGVCCIAAPIRDSSGEVTAAIGIPVPVDRLPKRRWKKVGQQVKRAAEEVSAKLGHASPANEDVASLKKAIA